MKKHLPTSLTLLLAACGGQSALEPTVPPPEVAEPVETSVERPLEEGIQEVTFDASQEAIEPAPPSIDVTTEAGTTVSFALFGDDRILLVEGGPNTSAPTLGEYSPFAESPRALYEMLAPGREVPVELAAASDRIVAAGNWFGGTGEYVPQPIFSGSFCDSLFIGTKAVATNSGAANRALNQGGQLRTRGFNVGNQWSRNDVVAMKAAVCVLDGGVDWTLRGRNCNACNYYTIWQKSFSENYWYYAYSYDNEDDFKIVSSLTTTQSNNVFRHRLASCHDYYHRVVWTSSAEGSCRVQGAGTDYFNNGSYHGADPSNIYTSSSWN